MSGERILPGIGLTGFWNLGDNSWKPGMDANLRMLSAIVQLRVLSRTTPFPFDDSNSAAFADGDIYIVPIHDSNSLQDSNSTQGHNYIAVHDAGDWYYFAPKSGWIAYVVDEDKHYTFTQGGAWRPLDGDLAVANETGNITVTAADASSLRFFADDSNSTAPNFFAYLPHDDAEALNNGYTVSVVQLGDLPVTFAAAEDSNSGGDLTILYPADMLPTTRGKNSVISATKKSANLWIVYGDLLPA